MPDFFSISKRVPPFPSRRVLNRKRKARRREGEDQEAKCGNKVGKGKKLKGKITPCFNVRFRTFISPLTGSAFGGKRKKSEELFRVRLAHMRRRWDSTRLGTKFFRLFH